MGSGKRTSQKLGIARLADGKRGETCFKYDGAQEPMWKICIRPFVIGDGCTAFKLLRDNN